MSKNTIYWADDDPEDMDLFDEAMTELSKDHTIVKFKNGREVLDHLYLQEKKNFPCTIILDINMPVLNGRETLAILKSQKTYQDIPIVLLTTSRSEVDKAFCKQFNTDIFTKPPSYALILEVVKKLLSYCCHE